jgi:mono/diheme cytochrome c family protein
MLTANYKTLLVWVLVAPFLLIACGNNETDADESPKTANGAYTAAMIDQGELYFGIYCIACHGPAAKGIPGLGVDLTASEFVKSKTDEELIAFIHEGRPADHPDNTTGVVMPANGGFPNLTDEQLLSIIAFIRSSN